MSISLTKLKELATIKFEPLQEDERPEDHFDDEENIKFVKEGLKNSYYEACPEWFCAKVTATYAGITSEPEYLGCCSYESYDDFINEGSPGTNYAGMVEEALTNLCAIFQDLQEYLDLIKS